MSSANSVSNAELDEFVSNAEAIHAAVSGLASGSLKPEDTNALLSSLERKKPKVVDPLVEAMRKEQREKEAWEKKRQGTKGEGARPGYLYFCRNCFREYEFDPATKYEDANKKEEEEKQQVGSAAPSLKCIHCQAALITRSERMTELKAKVEVLSTHKADRARRRQQFAAWKAAKAAEKEGPKMVVLTGNQKVDDATKDTSESLASKYQDWDLWEPSSDDESEVPEPDHPEFAAMKADIEAREAKKKAAKAVSDSWNEKGNQAVKQREYIKAVECYTQAIDIVRGEKNYYTNRALAFIHTFDFQKAIKDCQTAIDIFDCFEGEHKKFRLDYKNMKLILKAYIRRGKAELGLNLLADAKKSLEAATNILKEIYEVSGRKGPEYMKSQKEELAEIAKLVKQIQEKEGFEEEEKMIQGTIAPTESTTVATTPTAIKVVGTGPADTNAIATLLTSLTIAHQQIMGSSSSTGAASDKKEPTWDLFSSGLQFLSLALEVDGNKERLVSHVESRVVIDVILKLVKQLKSKTTPSSSIIPKSSSSLPESLPDFAAAIPLFSPSHPSHTSNCITFREKDGFAALGKYFQQLFHLVSAATSTALDISCETIKYATKVLMMITDRENGREYLVSATHAPIITDLVFELLFTNGKNVDAETKLFASNLLANLAFQQRYRLWLCSTPEQQSTVLDRIYQGVMSQVTTCSLTSTNTKASGNAALLSSGLSIIINLLTHQPCRLRFVEAPVNHDNNAEAITSSAAETSPFALLLAALKGLTTRWSEAKFTVVSGSILSEVSEKVLSILMNLAVDDFANVKIFSHAHWTSSAVALVKLVSQPTLTSASSTPASSTSIQSSLSPLLVERALGVWTRALRCEHNQPIPPGQTKENQSRPLRTLFLQSNGLDILLSILTLHPYATEEDDVSTTSVLTQLQAGSASSVSSFSTSPAANFRYTRLTMEHASVCLAVCMAAGAQQANQLAKFTFQGCPGLLTIVSLLSSKHKNIAGNACLALDAVSAVPELVTRPELSGALEKLLAILKDPSSKSAHQNAAKAAILIGRAPNNSERWVAMRGVEIISTVLKMK